MSLCESKIKFSLVYPNSCSIAKTKLKALLTICVFCRLENSKIEGVLYPSLLQLFSVLLTVLLI